MKLMLLTFVGADATLRPRAVDLTNPEFVFKAIGPNVYSEQKAIFKCLTTALALA